MIRTAQDYLSGLKDGREIYYRGERVADILAHPILSVAANHNAALFDMSYDPELKKGLVCDDEALKEPVCRFYVPPTSKEALLERSRLIDKTTKRSLAMFNICKVIGSDALFALRIVTKALDRKKGTDYFQRVEAFHKKVLNGDLTTATAQTDVKGDRSKRPSLQKDPDLYVRVKERRPDGIIVSGAKVHITQAPVADEIFVIPSRMLSLQECDYGLAFAVNPSSPGLRMICRPILEREPLKDPMEGPRVYSHALVEALIIFEDVFIPNERVFLLDEPEAAGKLALQFALWHRFSAVSYRSAMADAIVAMAAEIARANGILDKSHIRRNIVNLIQFAEIQRMAAKLAAFEGVLDEATGIVCPNPLDVNVGKLYSNARYLDALQSLIDCAGGLAATAPSVEDFRNPSLKPLVLKYLQGSSEVSPERRFRLFLLIREHVSLLGGLESVTMVHAEGSVEASVIELMRTYDFKGAQELLETLLDAQESQT